jgi:hypothetical protein
VKNNSPDINFSSNDFNLVQLAYYGTAFNKAPEYEIGYMSIATRFQGTQVGGNVNNPLGHGALIRGSNRASPL